MATIQIQQTRHIVTHAPFFALERAASGVAADELASRRAAWLGQRPSDERAGLGIPAELPDAMSARYWVLSL